MNKKFFPEPVEALVLSLLVVLGTFIITFSFLPVLTNLVDKEVLDTYMNIILSYNQILFLIIPFFYCYKKGFNVKEIFRINPVNNRILLFSVVLSISLFIITDEIEHITKILIPPPESLQKMFSPLILQTPTEWIFLIFGSAIVSAIGEESLFRGFLQTTLEKKGDPSRAVILSSVAWVIIYPNIYLAIPVFILGVFMGFVAWKTKSLLPSMVIHSTFALVTVAFLSDSFKSNLEWYFLGDHVSPILIILAIGGIYLAVKNIESS